MDKRKLTQLILLSSGIALLLAGLFFQQGPSTAVALQGTSAPTQDRLAEPTLPASPSQADYGAQVYWLNCSPCHGDKAQGLTDEFRQQYPEEDRNCWTSHCHGAVTYENGFKIPKVVPALVGSGTLAKYPNAATLNGFMRASMPLQNPNSLSEEDYYKITAFLLRQNGLIDDRTEVNASNAAQIVVSRATPAPTPQQSGTQGGTRTLGWIILIGSLAALFILLFALKKSKNTTTI